METTFITIHDLTHDARVLYSSDSIVDILGHTPDEVLGRPCWDFFHPDEVPLAREFHSRGVKLDKAAVLSYCSLRNRQGQWVCCECCFSVVYNVMVVCTSIYRRGISSQQRAVQAPIVRRLFSSSPNDPRYHMLSHLSSKFTRDPDAQAHEPRAALFLNRFTRTLTIMYATSGIEDIIGISGDEMKGKSFYFCIQDQCQQDAIRCLESAKGNDSIAYLRFMFQDPRGVDQPAQHDDSSEEEAETDASMTDATSDDDGQDRSEARTSSHEQTSASHGATTSGSGSTPSQRGSASASASSGAAGAGAATPQDRPDIELEAVVSCTSDGLVVCLRRARPPVPDTVQPAPVHRAVPPATAPADRGTFAAPWAADPVFYPPNPGYQYYPQRPVAAASWERGDGDGAAPGGDAAPRLAGPSSDQLFRSISEVAVFAWALTGINGSLADYSRGVPSGESQPQGGLPVWEGASHAYGAGVGPSASGSAAGGGGGSAAGYPTPFSRDASGSMPK